MWGDNDPMKRRDILLVAIRSPRATGRYGLSYEIDVAAMNGQLKVLDCC